VHSNRTTSSDHKLHKGKTQLNIWKKIFTVRVVKHWNTFPRETVEFLFRYSKFNGIKGPEQSKFITVFSRI